MHDHVDAGVIFNEHKNAEVLLKYAAVAKMTVCVTFCAPRSGPKNINICARSEYVTFSTISAIAVRKMTVCVTFGAPHFGFPVQIGDTQPLTTSAGYRMEEDFGKCGLKFRLVGGAWRLFSRRTSLSMQVQDDYVRDCIVGFVNDCCCNGFAPRRYSELVGKSSCASFRHLGRSWKTVPA